MISSSNFSNLEILQEAIESLGEPLDDHDDLESKVRQRYAELIAQKIIKGLNLFVENILLDKEDICYQLQVPVNVTIGQNGDIKVAIFNATGFPCFTTSLSVR